MRGSPAPPAALSLARDPRAAPDPADTLLPRTWMGRVSAREPPGARLPEIGLAQRTSAREWSVAVPFWAVAAALALWIEARERRRARGSITWHRLGTPCRRRRATAPHRQRQGLPRASLAVMGHATLGARVRPVRAVHGMRARRAVRRLAGWARRRTRGLTRVRRCGRVPNVGWEDRYRLFDHVLAAVEGRHWTGVDGATSDHRAARRQ